MSKHFNLNKFYAGNDPIFKLTKSELVIRFCETAKDLDFKIASLDDMLDKFLIKYKDSKDEKEFLKNFINSIEDGHAGHILRNKLQWKLLDLG